jgi:Holliday junction resolvasome RuvABC endonuclease subunit
VISSNSRMLKTVKARLSIGLVVGIDVGYRNLGMAVVRDGDWQRPVFWQVENLLPGKKYSEEALYQATRNWCVKYAYFLGEAKAIVLERQMTQKFAVMNTVIRTLYHDKTIVVHPSTVGALHKLPSTRAEKKKAAVQLVNSNVPIPAASKQDDLADAMLLVTWHLFSTYPDTRGSWNERDQGQIGRYVLGGHGRSAAGGFHRDGANRGGKRDRDGSYVAESGSDSASEL